MKVSSDQWYWQGQMAPPYWLADSLDVGDQSFDAWGRKNGEIVDLRIFEWGGTKKEVEIVLNLQVKVNNRKNQFLLRTLSIKYFNICSVTSKSETTPLTNGFIALICAGVRPTIF